MSHAFAPLGVFLSFFQPKLQPGKRTFQIMLVNDESETASGSLTLSLVSTSGAETVRVAHPFQVAPLGQVTMYLDLEIPDQRGEFILQAKADKGKGAPTLSRRKVTLTAAVAK